MSAVGTAIIVAQIALSVPLGSPLVAISLITLPATENLHILWRLSVFIFCRLFEEFRPTQVLALISSEKASRFADSLSSFLPKS